MGTSYNKGSGAASVVAAAAVIVAVALAALAGPAKAATDAKAAYGYCWHGAFGVGFRECYMICHDYAQGDEKSYEYCIKHYHCYDKGAYYADAVCTPLKN
ncbi:hypothetical protein Scep_009099 [Stephania cephalantha]|uniref:Uncharacterized protein n=1 Tax=Stephania cephalantha TaxID=152367 RepID=A0AAP0PC83_9MAGN